ncbi:MAG TPA: hypothetical protein VJS68_00905 [Thermoplasmata archaeon]|nr:hypothetical protein [Thermoplasmata archaeon]
MIPRALADVIRVESTPGLASELLERHHQSFAVPTPIWATDLVEPRRSFWRSRQPVPSSPERKERMRAGRAEHDRVGSRIAEARFLEVRFERDGVVGQIDILDEIPIELKTTQRLPAAQGITESRPGYFEQLGIYCGLVGVSDCRLVVLSPGEAPPGSLTVLDCRYAPPDQLWSRVLESAEEFRQALATGSPATLPRCPWFNFGCEFRAAGVCDCTGVEPERFPIRDLITSVKENPPEAERIRTLLPVGPSPAPGPPGFRFRELVYPRRAYFERTRGGEEGSDLFEPVPSGPDSYRDWLNRLQRGPPKEWSRAFPNDPAIRDRVACFRDSPVLFRVSRNPKAPEIPAIPSAQPQYIVELAFRCAALGKTEGTLLVVYPQASHPEDQLRAGRLLIQDLAGVQAELNLRMESLRGALAGGDPQSLAPCLPWMVTGCPYRAECGCGSANRPEDEATRRQR